MTDEKDSKMSEEDEEAFRRQKLVDFLVSAGYFRARITGLTDFDRIVGGMTWAITASGIPIDMSVEFKENANIREKLAMSEKICRALIKMKCPFPIRPHQIQGLHLDGKPIFPVIQWLLKAVFDHRRITGNQDRNYSTFLYNSSFDGFNNNNNLLNIENDKKDKNKLLSNFDYKVDINGSQFCNELTHDYSLSRKFIRKTNSKYYDSASYVDSTLLEYGFTFRANETFGTTALHQGDEAQNEDDIVSPKGDKQTSSKNSSDKRKPGKITDKFGDLMIGLQGGKSLSKNNKKTEDENLGNVETEEEENKRLNKLQKSMEENKENISVLAGSKVAGLIDKTNISNVENELSLEDSKNNKESEEELILKDKEYQFNKKKERIENKLLKMTEKRKEYKEKYTLQLSKLETLENNLDNVSDEKKSIKERINKLTKIENKSENKNKMETLKNLVRENESLKKQRTNFEKQCKLQASEFKKKLDLIDLENNNENNEEMQRINKIQKLYDIDSKKYDKVRKILAEKNQEMSRITRKLESYPSRAELLQYEKRFVELYNLTNERLKETKKYFHLYNSLNDSYECVSNEVKLLEQIKNEFPKRCKNLEDIKNFNKSLNKFIESLDKLLEQSKNKLEQVKNEKDDLGSKYNELLNYQRKYYVYVKEFQDASIINGVLNDKIDNYQQQYHELTE